MSERCDVLVLGGGVVGLTTAWFLARAGAGIVPPGDVAHARTPYDQLRAHSASMFPALSQTLREQTGIDNGYFVCGGLELPGDSPPDTATWRDEGVAFEYLQPDALHRLEPRLAADVDAAWFLPAMAQLRNPRHLQALEAVCVRLGVTLCPHRPARGWQRHGSRVTAVETDAGRLEADQVLIAAGAWTDELMRPLGWTPGVRPVRGQIVLLDTGIPGVRPVVLEGKRYLVPRADGRVLIGATEEEAGFDARPTADGVAELLAFAARVAPALRDAPLERCWAGLRPASLDGLPYLGRVPGFDNLFVAAGHFRSGLQLSPATGLVMKELLLGETPTIALDDFRPDRPPAAPHQTAFRS
jgi:glycine oxidase